MSMLTIWGQDDDEKEKKGGNERKKERGFKWVSFTKWLPPCALLSLSLSLSLSHPTLKYGNSWIWWEERKEGFTFTIVVSFASSRFATHCYSLSFTGSYSSTFLLVIIWVFLLRSRELEFRRKRGIIIGFMSSVLSEVIWKADKDDVTLPGEERVRERGWIVLFQEIWKDTI